MTPSANTAPGTPPPSSRHCQSQPLPQGEFLEGREQLSGLAARPAGLAPVPLAPARLLKAPDEARGEGWGSTVRSGVLMGPWGDHPESRRGQVDLQGLL